MKELYAVCGDPIFPGDELVIHDGTVYCGCSWCRDKLFLAMRSVYDPEGDRADLEYEDKQYDDLVSERIDEPTERARHVKLDIFREEGEEG